MKKLIKKLNRVLASRAFLVFSSVLLLLSLCQVLFGVFRVIQTWQLLDLTVYHQAATAFIQGLDPYALSYAGASELKFIYPPGALLFFSPLAGLSPQVAAISLTMLSLVSFGGAVAYVHRYHWQGSHSKLGWLVFCAALLLQTFPLKFNLAMGQINLIVLGLAVLSLWAMRHKQLVLAGGFLGSIASLKLFSLAFLPLFLIRKEWKLAASTAGSFVLLNFWNLKLAQTFFVTIAPKLLGGLAEYPSLYSQSIAATGLRLGLSPTVNSVVTLLLVLALYGGLVLYARKHSLEQTLLIGWAMIGLFSGNGWQHYFVLSYPMILVFFARPRIFLPIWLILALHFSGSEKILEWLPIIGSHHSLLILGLVSGLVFYEPFMKNRTEWKKIKIYFKESWRSFS